MEIKIDKASQVLSTDVPERRLWATAVIMQTSVLGKYNHVVGYREALSGAEASGMALENAAKMYPDAQICGSNVCEIEDQQIKEYLASKGVVPCYGKHVESKTDRDREVVELRIYLDGWVRKIIAGTGLLIAIMAVAAYILQFFRR